MNRRSCLGTFVVTHACVLGFILSVCSAPAQAAPITLNYDFTASGFGPGAPVDPVVGSFSVTFDNATNLSNVTSGFSLTGFNLPLDSAPAFNYFQHPPGGPGPEQLQIGGLQGGAGVLTPSDDFILVLNDVSTTPRVIGLSYSRIATGDAVFGADELTLTPTEMPPAIPEPASLTLLGLGLAGIGTRRWRQRKAS